MKWQAFRTRALWCWHQLLTLGLAAVVAIAVLVAISQQLLPLLDRYRPDVEAALSRGIGVPVTLQRLQGEVDGTQLRLSLLQLDLHDPAVPGLVMLRVPEVELRPSVWQSLLHFELRVDVRLRGLDIHIEQQPDGSFQLRELAHLARRDRRTADKTLRFVLRQPVLAVSESRVGLKLNRFPALNLSNVELVNRNEGDRHRLAGRVRLPGVASDLALQSELMGDPLRWQEGRVRLWAELPVLDFDKWLAVIPPGAVELTRLRAGGRYWLDFQRGRLDSAQAQLFWPEAVFRHEGREHALRNLRGVVSWQRNGVGWHLAANEMRGLVDGQVWPVPRVAVRAGRGTLTVAAARANVRIASRLLATAPVPEALRSWLQEAAPTGELVALRADLETPAEGRWRLRRLDASVRALGIAALPPRPGVSNLSGWLRWTPQHAWLGLDSRALRLELPAFFGEVLALQTLRGQARLARVPGGWRLDTDQLQVANADLQGNGVASLVVPEGNAGAARLSMVASLFNARVDNAWRYVPHNAGEHAIDWLRQGLKGGLVRRADLAFEGPLRKVPDHDLSRFLLRADVVGAQVDYLKGWPQIRNLDVRVVLDGHGLELDATRAQLMDATRSSRVHAVIPDFHEPRLEIDADLASSGQDLMTLFGESPLRQQLPGITEVLALSGPLQGRLGLAVPLKGGPVDVVADAVLKDNTLELKPARLLATGLGGSLHFSTREGLSSQRLDARLLEAPVQAAIQTRKGEIQVDASGTVDVPALRRWLGSSLLDVASGNAAYQARVTLPPRSTPRLQLDSTLAGMRIRLPAPFGKAAQETVPLRYQASFGGKEQPARVQYGQRLSAGLVWQGSRLDRALLRLDSSTAAWPTRPGLEIEGRLARFDVEEWQAWLSRFQSSGGKSTVAARGESAMPSLTRVDLETRQLLAAGWQLRDARVGLVRQDEGWELALDSAELAGTVRLPDAPSSEIGVSVSRMQWPLPIVPGRKEAAAAPANPVAALGNRPVGLKADNVRLKSLPGLGALGGKARLLPLPNGLRVEGIALRSPVLDFAGTLDWQWRGGFNTSIHGKAESSNPTGLLNAFGYSPRLDVRHASADLGLAWRGPPDQPNPAALEGRLKLQLDNGRLLDVSTTTSASRVFGWFDIENLGRRLKGDFSDLSRKGLVFDRITLEGPLQAGVMKPAAFEVKGPSLQVQGNGWLDIGQKKLDQQITVTLPVSGAVPIAAVVVAGPVVGGAVAAAQMAFNRQLDKATRLHYHVSGDWASLRVEKGKAKVAAPAPGK